MKKFIFIAIILLLNNPKINAQTGFENFFLANAKDSKKLLDNYFSPKVNGYLNALNANWYHTAKVHKPFGFDFTLNLSSINYPASSKTYTINNLESINLPTRTLTSNTAVGSNNTETATISTTINNREATAVLNLPNGENSSVFKNSNVPIAQLNLGVSSGFEVMLRLLPTIKPNNNNESLNIFGIGLKKEITKWFSSLKDKPIHISLLMSYANMNVNYGIKNQTLPSGNLSGLEATNAFTKFNLKTYTFQTIASYHFKHFNFFGGLAYNNGSASYTTFGDFKGQYVTNSDPITTNLNPSNSLAFNSNGVAASLGGRLNLRYFKIFTSYTIQEFGVFNIGASLSIK